MPSITQASQIKDAFLAAMYELFDVHIDAGRGPRDLTVEAYAELLGCSLNDFRRLFAKYARSKGSNLFFLHYPAFGQPGCEYEKPE
jgi:hypothetical protein